MTPHGPLPTRGIWIDACLRLQKRAPMSSAATSYDELPYDGGSFPLTHPLKLGWIAALHGLTPAPVRACRVLEIGCGDGSNLLPLAEAYPEAQFHGFDLSQRHIDLAQGVARDLGLSNVIFEQRDVLDFTPAGRTYDYIIAHGIFSWVPEPVRQRLLQVTQACLSEQGIATISFNTLPGWHIRGVVRDALGFHGGHFRTTAEKLSQAKALLRFLADSVPEGSAYGGYLRFEAKELSAMPDSYLLHEFLEGENHALYLHAFVDLVRRHGLDYLGDAERPVTAAGHLAPPVRTTLTRLARDTVGFEQYADFVTIRSFRRAVLVRSGRRTDPGIRPDCLRKGWYTSDFRPDPAGATPNQAPGAPERFSNSRGVGFSTDDPWVRTLLHRLADAAPREVAYDDLLRAWQARPLTRAGVAPQPGLDDLNEPLSVLLDQGVLDASLEPYPEAGRSAASLRVSPLARFEAQQRSKVTNRRHAGMKMDPFVRWLLGRLDGTRTRDQLVDDVVQAIAPPGQTLVVGGQKVTDPVQVRATAEESLGVALARLEAAFYLVP